MKSILDWLAALPPVALYFMMFFAAGIENVFPPLPSDTVVAFGSFLAARGSGTAIGAFLATWAGNLTGAALMYGAGRKYGADRIDARFMGKKGPAAESRLETLYGRYGMMALFLSRFIPAARALVPPFAGAFRLPFVRSMIVMGVASGLWYGLISILAFRAGANFDVLARMITRYGRLVALAAGAVAIVAAIVYVVRRRRAPGA